MDSAPRDESDAQDGDRPFREHVREKVSVFVSPDYGDQLDLDDLFRLPDVLDELEGEPSRQAGRVSSWRWCPRWAAGPGFHVRQYVHGGALGRLFGTVFLGSWRMLNEFRLAHRARGAAVPTSRPVALRVERVYGPFVRAHILTELMPNARNLLEWCRDRAEPGQPPPAIRAPLARAVAAAIAAVHAAGILHADLNLKNLLVRGTDDEPEVFIIDFDRAEMTDPSPAQRLANLLRLERSVLKWPASRAVIGLSDRLRTLRAYAAATGMPPDAWRELAGSGATPAPARHIPAAI